jgi:hypothetical protein
MDRRRLRVRVIDHVHRGERFAPCCIAAAMLESVVWTPGDA